MEKSIIKIQTPNKFLLNGIFFGSNEAKNVFIYIHGLGGNLFSHTDLLEKLVDKNNSVLAFNNRGSEIISRVKKIDKKEAKGYKSHAIGMVHEVFTDCIDDIEGAVKYAQKIGTKNIFLIGHSTGCQKSIYYLFKKQKAILRGALLLAPMSDFADAFAFTDRKVYNKAVSFAQKMVRDGKKHGILPKRIWPYPVDAQRFLSLFTPGSVEEIFSYASNKNPKILKSVKLPKLVVLAGKDEYRDREISKIADWFEENLANNNAEVKIIKNASHSFKGHINQLSEIIKSWVKEFGY